MASLLLRKRGQRRVILAGVFGMLSVAWSWVMRGSLSIIPGIDRNAYLVLDDFGRMGCAWRETNVEDTDFEAVEAATYRKLAAERVARYGLPAPSLPQELNR
jgi:hypothetical protein